MWALFTSALARATSTTQVAIINTSTNFMVTAVLGFLIFTESLPPLWWLGAALLVAGNVIVGRRDEGDKPITGSNLQSSTLGSSQRNIPRDAEPQRNAPEGKSLLDGDEDEEGVELEGDHEVGRADRRVTG